MSQRGGRALLGVALQWKVGTEGAGQTDGESGLRRSWRKQKAGRRESLQDKGRKRGHTRVSLWSWVVWGWEDFREEVASGLLPILTSGLGEGVPQLHPPPLNPLVPCLAHDLTLHGTLEAEKTGH